MDEALGDGLTPDAFMGEEDLVQLKVALTTKNSSREFGSEKIIRFEGKKRYLDQLSKQIVPQL